jgi:methionine-rich copper-binding protein CopC
MSWSKSRLAIGFTFMLCASAAFAHVHLKQSTPAEGAVLQSAPAQIVLTFSEPALVTALSIQQAGKAKQSLGPLPTEAAQTLTVASPGLTAGSYVVTWRAVSPDKHVMSGTLHFRVGSAG